MKNRVFFIEARREEGAASLAQKAEMLYLALGQHEKIEIESFVALKIHFGEKGNRGYIKPEWLERVIWQVRSRTDRAFLTDSNTLYEGRRSNAVDHLRLAYDHGFTPDKTVVPVIIADGLLGSDGEDVRIDLPRVKSARISREIVHSDFLVCLSHFTGHIVTGIGCTLKNLGMGCASRAGKLQQHADVHPKINKKACRNCGICLDHCPADAIIPGDGCAVIVDEKCIGCGECLAVCRNRAVRWKWDEDSRRIQEKMVEYAFAVHKTLKGNIACLSFLLKITKDCDCLAKDQPDIVEDIGILSSLDPVALDTAAVDLVLKRAGKDVLRKANDIDWLIQLQHGEKIGLGSMSYELVSLKESA